MGVSNDRDQLEKLCQSFLAIKYTVGAITRDKQNCDEQENKIIALAV